MSRKQQSRSRTALMISIIAVVILAAMIGFDQVRKPVEYVTNPLLRLGSNIGRWVKRIPEPFRDKTELNQQIEELQNEKTNLVRENALLRTFIEEDTIASRMNDFLTSINEQGTQAHIIGKPSGEQQLVLIDKGSDDGIKNGQAVITDSGFLIGTIYETTSRSSQVMLITDASKSIAAKIQNDQSSPGVVHGEFGLSIIMELIPQNDNVEKGQTVVTSALEPIIPPNLIIGTISTVEKIEGGIFQTAHITTPIFLNRVELVSVITSRNE